MLTVCIKITNHLEVFGADPPGPPPPAAGPLATRGTPDGPTMRAGGVIIPLVGYGRGGGAAAPEESL